jgi:GLPGLI family protein
MNRIFYVSLLLLFTFHLSSAQEKIPIIAKAYYNLTHVNDTANRTHPFQEELILYIGAEASLYTGRAGERSREQIQEQMNDSAFDGNLTITASSGGMGGYFFFQPDKKHFKEIKTFAGKQYSFNDEYPSLDWKLVDESKNVGGYACQRADVSYGGRTYIAWFTAELPFPYGPWKLQGLPGLILEAKDASGDVSFSYAGFETLESGDAITLSPQVIKTNKKDYEKMVKIHQERAKSPGGAVRPASETPQPILSGNSFQDNSGMDPSRIKSVNVLKAAPEGQSTITNNPIELK